MTTNWFLGRCLYEPRPHTRVQPAAFAEGGAWLTWSNWVETFPNEGTVFTASLPVMSVDTLFAFDAMEAADPSPKDRYRIREWRRVEEVLDYRHLDPEETRKAFVETGIPGRKGAREAVVVALPDATCVRITLVPDANTDRSVAELLDLEKLKLYSFDVSLFDGVKVDGRWLTVPDVTIGAEQGTVDWSLDKDFLESLLRQLRRLAAPDNGTLPFPATKGQVHSFLTALDRQGLLPARQGDWRNANTRVWHLADDLRLGIASIDEIVELLGSLRPIADKLSAELESRRSALEEELTSRLEKEISERLEKEYSTLSDLNMDLQQGNAELTQETERLRLELEEVTERKTRVSSELMRISDRLAASFEHPNAVNNDALRRLAADIEATLRGEGISFTAAIEGVPPRSRVVGVDTTTALAWSQFSERLAGAAALFGFNAEDLELMDLAARAGQIVLLPHDIAPTALECYSSVLSGGSFVVQSLDPTFIGYDDLWRTPGSDSSTPLSRAWTAAARNPSVARVVLLEGIERTPLDLWLPSLVTFYESSERPENLLVFVSMGGKVLDSERSPRDLTDYVLPVSLPMQEGITGALLNRIVGEPVPTGWVNFETRARPTRTNLQNFLMKCLKEVPPRNLPFAIKAHAAAMTVGIADVDLKIRGMARNIAGSEDHANPIKIVTGGRDFLRKLSN